MSYSSGNYSSISTNLHGRNHTSDHTAGCLNKSNGHFIFTSRYFKKYWRHMWNWKYGNCYTFNFGAAEDNTTLTQLRTNKAGSKYGWYGCL